MGLEAGIHQGLATAQVGLIRYAELCVGRVGSGLGACSPWPQLEELQNKGQ